jgi:AAA family ATP:ADP antiporter
MGVYQTLLIGAIALALQLGITWYVDKRERERLAGHEMDAVRSPQGVSNGNAFGMVVRNPYLLAIGFMLLVLFQIDAMGEFILGSVVKERATEMVAAGTAGGLTVSGLIGQFYSRYYALINGGSLLLQLFVVSRIVKRWGVSGAVTVSPTLAMVAFATIAMVPELLYVLIAMVASKSTDYSLNNTVRNMLFLPCTREEKYSAKQAIDSLFVRLGDVSSAALVFLGTSVLSWTTKGFAQVTFISACLALGLAIIVGRYYRQFGVTGSMGVTTRTPETVTPQLRRQSS